MEQTVVPLVGKSVFGIESSAVIVSFIASVGAIKAVLNLFAGNLSDKWEKNVLVLGWLFGIPVQIILLLAPGWNWISRRSVWPKHCDSSGGISCNSIRNFCHCFYERNEQTKMMRPIQAARNE